MGKQYTTNKQLMDELESAKQRIIERGKCDAARKKMEEALELFRSQPGRLDIVITDMTMPNMTGLELAREFMHIRPDIPVILCMRFSEAITPGRVRCKGLQDCIMNPMVKNQLAEAIRRVLDHKE
jgi:two-component system cell cycle sensor histidine kinase/response regulator CckA